MVPGQGGSQIGKDREGRSLRTEEFPPQIVIDADYSPSLGAQQTHAFGPNEATGSGDKRLSFLPLKHWQLRISFGSRRFL